MKTGVDGVTRCPPFVQSASVAIMPGALPFMILRGAKLYPPNNKFVNRLDQTQEERNAQINAAGMRIADYVCVVPAAIAQDVDKPSVAIMGYGWYPSFEVTEGAIFDMLQSYDFINADENDILSSGEDLEGEHIDVFRVDPGRGRDE